MERKGIIMKNFDDFVNGLNQDITISDSINQRIDETLQGLETGRKHNFRFLKAATVAACVLLAFGAVLVSSSVFASDLPIVGGIFEKGQNKVKYSIKVEKDSIYADVIPSGILKNVGTMFQKQVRMSMKYYDKYKDADDYTRISKIPDKYRDFIDIAKEIKDSDEIVIRYPFYVYCLGEEDYYGGTYDYYFIAEKNQQKLCIFCINVNIEDEKVRIKFDYDKMLDHYFSLDENITEETLFYKVDLSIYAETPEKSFLVREIYSTPAEYKMQGDGVDDDTESSQFYQKNYEEKKDLILSYLKAVKKGKTMKKSGGDIKSELKKADEPINEEDLLDFSMGYGEDTSEDEEESIGGIYFESNGGIYLVVCGGVLCILFVGVVVMIRKQRWE